MASSTLPVTLCSSFNYSSALQPFIQKRLQRGYKQSSNISCNIEDVDRRNVLLGLGGLYGSAMNLGSIASAAPIPIPDLNTCSTAHKTDDGPDVPYSCCPPKPGNLDNIPYYKLPPISKLRIRPPAQALDEEYIAKYELAISRMKELDIDDPVGFNQQANVHCAYCNGAYKVGGKELQVHNSWLFFPFHRWYVYFYERILGSLIDDPTFGLPYWNWDNPKGMRMPPMFDRQGSSLYDEKRNPSHRGGKIIDLAYAGDDSGTADLQQIINNLTIMYRQMVTSSPTPRPFFGEPYILGTTPSPGAGTIEKLPHIPLHIWVGTKRDTNNGKYGEDMGNFYSAGLDPLFYCHHSNVDRMWNIWKTLGGKRKDIKDNDWLNSEFFFYDEKRNPYRVRVRDCLDHKKMGYDYYPMPIPWRNFKPQPAGRKVKLGTTYQPVNKVFPITKLEKAVCFTISRPATGRSQKNKDEKEEILKFKNVKHDDTEYIRFDVFLNTDSNVDANELDKAEYAGSYVSLPHIHGDKNDSHVFTTSFQLAITELLEDLKLEDDDTIVVTLVPKKGGQYTSIESVQITLDD